MANIKRNLTKTAKKKPTLTRTMVKSIDFQYIGDEPVDVDIRGYANALNWYNYMFDVDQSREFLVDYLKTSGYDKTVIAKVKKAPKYAIPATSGWIARMLANGNSLQKSSIDYMNNSINTLSQTGYEADETGDPAERSVVSIQERTRNKNNALITDIEELLDGESDFNYDFDVYDFLTAREATPAAANAIRLFYVGTQEEVNDADDPDVKESYGRRLRTQRSFWNKFIGDCDRFVGNVKSTKVAKPREKKAKSAVDIVKNLKYQKEFPALKIVSANPAGIVGANQVWVYNTKHRKITRFDAVGPAGLTVSGTTILGYDEDKSISKTLRKPEVVINELLNAGKITLRKVLENVKSAESKPVGRINSDVVILRVIK